MNRIENWLENMSPYAPSVSISLDKNGWRVSLTLHGMDTTPNLPYGFGYGHNLEAAFVLAAAEVDAELQQRAS